RTSARAVAGVAIPVPARAPPGHRRGAGLSRSSAGHGARREPGRGGAPFRAGYPAVCAAPAPFAPGRRRSDKAPAPAVRRAAPFHTCSKRARRRRRLAAALAGSVGEGDRAEVRLARLRTHAGEFGTNNLNGVVASGIRIGEGFQLVAGGRHGRRLLLSRAKDAFILMEPAAPQQFDLMAQRSLFDLQELDFESQFRVRRNIPARSFFSVGELGRNDELALAADLHAD